MEVWQSPVYCTCLENRRSEMVREFESHRFRQLCLVSSVVEQRLDKALVVGSNPAQGTNNKEKTKWGDHCFTHACSVDILY